MTLYHAIVLGIVQGLGEFLPISSSAHLVIFPWLFNFPDPGLTFDVALHVGTLISLLVYFYRDWIHLIRAFFTSFTKKPANWIFEEKLIWFILIGTIPAAIAGALLEDYAESVFRSPALIATMMVVMGIVLWIADRVGRKTKEIDKIGLKDSLWIGFSQALALVPGTSRSGVTITTGLFRGMTREAAARFSFLLSTPIVAGAALLKLRHPQNLHFGSIGLVGIAVSAVVGILAIKYMLYFLRRYSYSVYVWYRLIFAAVVFVAIFLKR